MRKGNYIRVKYRDEFYEFYNYIEIKPDHVESVREIERLRSIEGVVDAMSRVAMTPETQHERQRGRVTWTP